MKSLLLAVGTALFWVAVCAACMACAVVTTMFGLSDKDDDAAGVVR